MSVGVSFGSGDYVVFPKGLSCVWKVSKPVKAGIFSLSNDFLRKNCIRICFEFQDGNLGRLFYGFRIWVEDSKMKEVYKEKNSLRDSIKAIGKTGEPYWIFCDQLYDHWHREELADLVVPEKSTVINKCENAIKDLMDLLEKAEKG